MGTRRARPRGRHARGRQCVRLPLPGRSHRRDVDGVHGAGRCRLVLGLTNLAGVTDRLAQGRDAFDREAWDRAYEHLASASEAEPLEVADLERLAAAAYLTGRS